jgi:small conductance mechanosensitive channel
MTSAFAGITAAQIGTAAAIVVAAALLTRATTLVLRFSIRRVAFKRLSGDATRWRWRTRMIRPLESDGALSEIRRQHRIDALSLALARVAALVIWAATGFALLHVFGISVSVAVGGAGFLGLLLAFGGQGSVNDYVTGLHVLLEDRFGEGDEIEVTTVSGRNLRGVVTAHGMFGTRINAEGANHHIANRFMCEVTNHSQLGIVTTVDVDHPADQATIAAAASLASSTRREMPDVYVDSVVPLIGPGSDGARRTRVHLRTAHALGETDQHHLGQQLRELIDATYPPPDRPHPPTGR